jgi:hypothetical protein
MKPLKNIFRSNRFMTRRIGAARQESEDVITDKHARGDVLIA